MTRNPLSKNADEIHREAFVADLHCDTILPIRRGYDLSLRHSSYHIDLPRLNEGGVNLQVFACFTSPYGDDKSLRPGTTRAIKCLHSEIDRNRELITICRRVNEIESAYKAGKIAAVLAIEGGLVLEGKPSNLRYFHDLGIRLITIVHNQSTEWCTSWLDKEPAFHGLNDLGREMIAEMNRLGIVVDLSHSSEATFEEVMKITTAPVVASHSCCQSLCEHGRNLSDEQIRQLADNGGMVGVTFVSFFMTNQFSEAFVKFFRERPELEKALDRLFVSEMPEDEMRAKLAPHIPEMEKLEAPLRPLRPTVSTVVDHIDHVVNLVGPDHVGLGSDFDGMSMPPEGLDDCSMMPNITHELVRRGYSEQDIRKILGGNFLRVFEQACG
jgi:membrane dipeptidase